MNSLGKYATKLGDLGAAHVLDLYSLVCGEPLGAGISRQTYVYLPDPTLVIKVQVEPGRFQNQREWELWNNCQHHADTAKWLAPCVHVSDTGSWMLQRRTTPTSLEVLKRRAARVPKFLTDFKASNWGLLNGRPVCHDYGTSLVEAHNGMRRATWWA